MPASASRLASLRRFGARLGATLLFAAASLWAVAPLARGVAEAGVGGRLIAQLFICFASGTSQPDAFPGRPGPKDDRSACILCQAFCSGLAPLAARPGPIGATPVPSFRLARTVADRVAPTPRPDPANRPRAPPAV
ncbi:MAG: hypothetical protein FJX40_13075 [Alphaproteobacteria bacterium]|nr:hypothetical protein [Alphaproteobacteria bacterium]MBM3641685.1 hypothetical protein [Alphaproteobacteria bacterium]